MVAAKLANMQQGRPSNVGKTANWQNMSRGDASEMLNVSRRLTATAVKVEREAPAEITEAVKPGAISLVII